MSAPRPSYVRSAPKVRRPVRLTVVLAPWCPHCVPLSIVHGQRLARRLRIPFRTLDIDRAPQERAADRLVREYGDWSEDYLIPQVFLEWSDGRAEHLLTGFSEQVARTQRAWNDLAHSGRIARIRRGTAR